MSASTPSADTGRRRLMGAALALPWLGTATPVTAAAVPVEAPRLDPAQTRILRDWITVLVHAQLEQGPTPRWTHRDCAGLVRFAVAEALREHDLPWRRAMGLLGQRLPPDLDPAAAQPLRHTWRRADGTRGAFASALDLVQANTRFVTRQLAQARPADLLFYDFGDDQHLMLWMGPYLAYHTGRHEPGDSGLRALRVAELMNWPDTRWRPHDHNPNFVGLFRLAFMA